MVRIREISQSVVADSYVELQFIQEALYTDPYDQSLWFYHQYLMCTFDQRLCQHTMAPRLKHDQRIEYMTKEIDKLLEMLDGAEDCKWIFQSLIQLSTMYKASSGAWPAQADAKGDWVTQLRNLDPLRTGRWTELDRTLQSEI